MTYTWHIQIKSEVRALCKDGDAVLHDLVINEQPTTEEEAKAQAKTLLKMRALKDVLNPDWSAEEAARYAIVNSFWLDNKLLDAARKRWSAAEYKAEKWLLAGAYLENKNVKQWAGTLSVENELSTYIAQFDNDIHAFGAINQLVVQSPNNECKRHGLIKNNEWVYCSGVMLQASSTQHAGVAIVLSDEGLWQLMIVENIRPNQGRIESWDSPPTLEEARVFFAGTPESDIEKLIELK